MAVFGSLKNTKEPPGIKIADGIIVYKSAGELSRYYLDEIIEVFAFTRDDLTFDTLGLEIIFEHSEFWFTEDVVGFSEAVLKLGIQLGFDGNELLESFSARQIKTPFLESRECIWKRKQD